MRESNKVSNSFEKEWLIFQVIRKKNLQYKNNPVIDLIGPILRFFSLLAANSR